MYQSIFKIRRVMWFCSSSNLFNGWPARNQMDDHSGLCVQPVVIRRLVEGCEENSGLDRFVVGKGLSILITFSDTCEASHSYSTSSHFLKVLHNVGLKSLLINFHGL